MTTLIAPPQLLERLFHELTAQWRRETQFLSSTSAMATHPAYQRIIGLGPQVIPLVLAEMQREPGHWFWAASHDAWLRWGRDKGWIA